MNLLEYLETKKISRNRAAKALGQTRTHIGNICMGKNLPGRGLVKDIIAWSKGEVTGRELRPDWAEVMDNPQP